MARRLVLCVLAAVYAVLWCGGVASYAWRGGPPAGAAWTAPLFLAVSAALALLLCARGSRVPLLAAGALGLGVEWLGVHTGFPFGRYAYTAVLAPRIGGVPLVMAGAWVVLYAYARQWAAGWGVRRGAAALLAAAWLTALDLLIDPLAAGPLGYWRWADPGFYFGVPALNFVGWFFFAALLGFLLPPLEQPEPGVVVVGASIVAFFTLIALACRPAVAPVGAVLLLLQAGCQAWRRARPLRQPRAQLD